jgi:hypothetical protein
MRDVVDGAKGKEEEKRERERERDSDGEWRGFPGVDYPGGVRRVARTENTVEGLGRSCRTLQEIAMRAAASG